MKQPKPIYQYNYGNVVYCDNIPPVATETVKTSGCGIVASVMMLNAFGVKVTVQELAKISMDQRFRVSSGTAWALFPFIAKKYDLQMVQTDDMETVKKALQDGALAVCSMGPGTFTKSGHFILAYDYSNGCLYFNDPVSSARTGKGYSPELVQKEHKEYFIFTLERKMDWQEILSLASDSPEKWQTGIDVAVNAAKANGDLGPLEVFKNLPELIEKVYKKGCEAK
jgi:hypothetical protein